MILVFHLSSRCPEPQRIDAMMGFAVDGHAAACAAMWTVGLYDCVAAVEDPSLESAWELTNTISGPWTENTGVTVSARAALGCRSTSVGDVMLTQQGELLVVSSVGYTPITDYVSQLASLNGASLREPGQQPLDPALLSCATESQRRLLHATSVPLHRECEQGHHSWIHETGKLDPSYECNRCTEPYGHPE